MCLLRFNPLSRKPDVPGTQRWPGHVKARHFVLALRDYYRQLVEDKNRKKHDEETTRRGYVRQFVEGMTRKAHGEDSTTRFIADEDEWALKWITIDRMQAIAEAFDDDGSGFITIAEVNEFTSSRPKEWRYDVQMPHPVTAPSDFPS